MADKATIDYETRSACDLRSSGSWRYSLDPSTEILCLCYRLPSWASGRTALWHPELPWMGRLSGADYDDLTELIDWITAGKLVEAHNAWFERGVWTNIFSPRFGAPSISPSSWRCSAAKAAAHALPRGLDDACSALRLIQRKDAVGSKVMMKMTKPRKPRKAEREAGVRGLLWWETPELFAQLTAYCRQDVLTEAALSERLDDLSPKETKVYLLDQTINERGFQLDTAAVKSALTLITRETVLLNKELERVTRGTVKKATQRDRMLDWLDSQGLALDDTQGPTLDAAVERDGLSEPVRRALELMRLLGKSSTAKYKAMSAWACPDGRVRGGLLYHGAGTGRWAGAGVQPQNFPKGSIKDQEALWLVLKSLDRHAIRAAYGEVMVALSSALRGAIVARPGTCLFVADYAAIEARVVLWLAQDEDALDIFRRKEDIYKVMATDIYDIGLADVTPDQRQHGKQAVLGCGYQMGWSKFQATCAKFGIELDDETAERIVTAYRAKFWRVKQMWSDYNDAAVHAVCTKRPVDSGYVTWVVDNGFLYCVLPSGRRLAYPDPQIRPRQTPWGESIVGLTYMGVNPYSRKWQRQGTYGGMLVENVTQAVARDLMAEAMLRVEASGTYHPVLSVHDEVISEAEAGTGSVEEFEGLLTLVPKWAAGCPINAEGWTGTRYRK